MLRLSFHNALYFRGFILAENLSQTKRFSRTTKPGKTDNTVTYSVRIPPITIYILEWLYPDGVGKLLNLRVSSFDDIACQLRAASIENYPHCRIRGRVREAAGRYFAVRVKIGCVKRIPELYCKVYCCTKHPSKALKNTFMRRLGFFVTSYCWPKTVKWKTTNTMTRQYTMAVDTIATTLLIPCHFCPYFGLAREP